MYYYILESPQNRAIRQSYQKLRDILTHLGIAGEIVAASPARTPLELADMGVNKGYSTIVAVGGDQHINQVATATLGRAVLGVIPIEASPLVTEIFGVSDLRTAAETLKYRRLSNQDAVFVEPDTILFLDGIIKPPKLSKVSLVIDNKLRAHAYFDRLTVTRGLQVYLESTYLTESRKFLGLFTVGGQPVRSESLLHGRSIRLVTDPSLPLTIADRIIATTPIQLRLLPDSLKVITKRGTILE
jgi:hypothetical protein